MRKQSLSFCLATAFFLAGCAHFPVNPPLKSYSKNYGYRLANIEGLENTDSLFVALAFSGGGTRASALTYGVMQGLRDARIPWEGKTKSLLEETDLISSVSGGSFTAAYYALFGDRLFTDFEARFLKRDIQGELFKGLFKPRNFLRLPSPHFDRIDMAAELYDETLFDQKSFQDLAAARKKPFIALNATNLYLGDRFNFTQDQFDLMGSDLSGVRVARGVAASSAFPFLLSPITFKNYGGDPSIAKDRWIENSLKDYGLNARRYVKAKNALVYLDAANHPYVHLMDGGLSDNIGLRYIIDSIRDASMEHSLRALINQGKVKKLVVIVVNAKNDPADPMDKRESAPKLAQVAAKTATISMDNYSFESVEALRDMVENEDQFRRAMEDCQAELNRVAPGKVQLPTPNMPNYYIINVSLDGIKDPVRRKRLLLLPTSFRLSPDQVDDLVQAGRDLLNDSKEFQTLLKDLR